MLRFLKIFLGQLLKVILVVVIIGLGFYCAFEVDSWINPQKNVTLLEILLLIFGIIALLVGTAINYLIEYRQELSVKSFSGEILLNLLGLLSFGVGIFLVVALGIAGYSTTRPQENDPHGFAFGIIFLASGLVGIAVGFFLAVLVTALLKFFLGSKKELR